MSLNWGRKGVKTKDIHKEIDNYMFLFCIIVLFILLYMMPARPY